VLEHKWLLSERAKRDVGLEAAIKAYLAEGAPAPEIAPSAEQLAEEVATDLAEAVGQREDGVADEV
jgi:hypothetical protein